MGTPELLLEYNGAPAIASQPWYDELQALGTSRGDVQRLWDDLFRQAGNEPEQCDPHELDTILCSLYPNPVEQAALWVLIHERIPTYGSMMYLRMQCWNPGSFADKMWLQLGEWVVRQLAAMVEHGSDAVRESACYALWVDYFEVTSDAKIVFPRLINQISPERWSILLPASGPIPWSLKGKWLQACCSRPHLHPALLDALEAGISDLYGEVDMSGVGKIVEQIPEVSERPMLVSALSGPLRLWVGEIRIPPRGTEPPWDNSYLIGVVLDTALRATSLGLKPGSELVFQGKLMGLVRHLFVPITMSRSWPRWKASAIREGVVFLRIEGPASECLPMLAENSELWLPGLRAYLRSKPEPVLYSVPKTDDELRKKMGDLQKVLGGDPSE
jgi:hypothetical protein